MVKIFVAGHNGMVGSSIVRALKKNDQNQIITIDRKKLDLINQKAVLNFFKKNKPDQVYIASAKVGGIFSNQNYPADFIYENIMIQSNIIHSSFLTGVKKLLFLGSSCIYPKITRQPMKENQLLTGFLEPTNEAYAISKIAGIKMCESYNKQFKSQKIDYRSVMPTNLYGIGDNYEPMNSHVIPGLIRRFHEAKINKNKKVIVWGSGKPKREFLYVDDLASACLNIMNIKYKDFIVLVKPGCSHINVGSGSEISIKELARKVKDIIRYEGNIIFDKKKPDGTLLKLLDSNTILKTGWKPKINLDDGLILAYNDFLKKQCKF
ncbi:GDP-L-fucose synthase [Candidatus Pelagibacter bacterium]|nr:GDP-L-fucose synthase [Candidatus Pelagibacter bacterium]MDA8805009.1 GDP-L-fucose synthase [Candidatus Pelagibacter bacterium]